MFSVDRTWPKEAYWVEGGVGRGGEGFRPTVTVET